MTKHEKLTHKIKRTNVAFQHLKDGISMLKNWTRKNEDAKTYLWRIEKNVDLLTKLILKDIQTVITEESFQNIVKRMKND